MCVLTMKWWRKVIWIRRIYKKRHYRTIRCCRRIKHQYTRWHNGGLTVGWRWADGRLTVGPRLADGYWRQCPGRMSNDIVRWIGNIKQHKLIENSQKWLEFMELWFISCLCLSLKMCCFILISMINIFIGWILI